MHATNACSNEQFLACDMKTAYLIDNQVHHFNKLMKAGMVLNNAIQEHDHNKEDLYKLPKSSTKKGRTPTAEDKPKIYALTQDVSKLDKQSMDLLTKREKVASKSFTIYDNLPGEEGHQMGKEHD